MRKGHLYLGLVMWPFALLFALSALSFNHPARARGLHQFRIHASEVAEHTGFQPPNARAMADSLLSELNRGTARYELDGSPSFGGWALFAAPVTGGQQTLILSLDSGWLDVTERPDQAGEEAAPFERWRPAARPLDMELLANKFAGLLEHHGVTTVGPVRVHPEVHPELRLTLRDEQNRFWAAKFDLVTNELRATQAAGARGTFAETLERIHTQHHYPAQRDITWLWALFADLTALTLLLWSVTGLFMWWQQRKLRRVGAWIIVSTVIGSGLLMSSVVNHQNFGPALDE
jgi:hypothetical protein